MTSDNSLFLRFFVFIVFMPVDPPVCGVSYFIEFCSLEAWFNIVYGTYIHKYYFKYIHTYTYI